MSEQAFEYGAGPVPTRTGNRRRLRVAGETEAAYRPDVHDALADGSEGHGPVDPDVALARLREAVDLLARADLDRLSDRALLEHTVALDTQTTRLEARRLAQLTAVDRRAAFTADGCVTAGSWFKMRTRRDANAGATAARWARRLERFQTLRASFEAGRISFDHVLVVLRAAGSARRAAGLWDHQDALVALAEAATPADVTVAVRAICDAIDHRQPDGCGPDDARELDHARTFRGRGDLRATLDAVTAERFDNLLDAYSRPDPPDTDDDQRRSPAQIRHDAFDAILRAAEEHPDISSVQGARPHAVVFADLFTLLGRPDLASRTTKLGSGTPVDLEQVIHLLHDAKATGVLTLGPFRPVAFGRTQRVLPGWLRTALAAIHGTCVGPGCDRPIAWTDAAHSDIDWAAGGTTELDTTVPACRGHHGHHALIDIVGWNVDLDPDTAVATWTSPDRRTTIITHPPDP